MSMLKVIFLFQLSGIAAVKAKNVCLQLVDKHQDIINHGMVQLFTDMHPKRLVNTIYTKPKAPTLNRPILDLNIQKVSLNYLMEKTWKIFYILP